MPDHQPVRTGAPAWCGYPDPQRPAVGCWSLLSGRVRTEDDCAGCDLLHDAAPGGRLGGAERGRGDG